MRQQGLHMKTSRLALSMKGEEVVVKADYNVAIGALALGAALFAVKAPVPAVPITALGVLFAVQVRFDLTAVMYGVWCFHDRCKPHT